jgi:GT2 family glycosyltransferase
MDQSPTVSVVIVNWNGRALLDACLAAVLEQSVEGGHEVIVVDNGSSDGSVDFLRERFPAVRILTVDRNIGFSAGCNRGIRAARGRYVALLDNDARPHRDWLSALVDAAESDPTIGAVSSRAHLQLPDLPPGELFLDPNQPGFEPGRRSGPVMNHAGLMVLSDGTVVQRGFWDEDCGQYDQREEVFAAASTAALYRTAALDDAGLLDEDFFAYYDDSDLGWRLRHLGWKAIYEPAAVVDHLYNSTGGRVSAFYCFLLFRNRLLCMLKNTDARTALSGLFSTEWWSLFPREYRSHIPRIYLSILRLMPGVLRKRRALRRRLRAKGTAIEPWYVSRLSWDRNSLPEPGAIQPNPPNERFVYASL